ncbi:MAG: hypothetical protein WBR18_09500 [Anaerolineales bacterium]
MNLGRSLKFIAATFGALIAGGAIFAYELGLDSNPDWGPSRKLMLAAGIAMVAAAWLPGMIIRAWRRSPGPRAVNAIVDVVRRFLERTSRRPIVHWARRSLSAVTHKSSALIQQTPILRTLAGTPYRLALASGILIWVVATVSYIWIGSIGTWTHWPPTTSYFNLLANGFLDGRLSLPVATPPELLSLPDPYVMQSRSYLQGLWDVSYFRGEFFLYWGPVPAAVLAAVKFAASIEIDDGILTIAYTSGSTLMAILCILELWVHWPRRLPWWLTTLPSVAIAWATPMVWLVTRGAVYEVAIAAGQFFLLAGLLAVIPSFLGKSLGPTRLVVASGLLALAIGSRINLGPACLLILLIAFTTSIRRSAGDRKRMVSTLLAATIPMIIMAAALGLYNYGRFGSILETGHRFQLGRTDTFHAYGAVFGLESVIPNLYNYFLNGLQTLTVFPYLKPGWGKYYIWITHTYAPEGYHTEKVAGILWTVPFLWLLAPTAQHLWMRLTGAFSDRERRANFLGQVSGAGLASVLLFGVFLALFSPLAGFHAVSLRHEVDFFPTLGLLATVGYWSSYLRFSPSTPGRRRLWVGLSIPLVFATAAIGLLLAMTGYQSNFETFNPGLFQRLTSIFTF